MRHMIIVHAALQVGSYGSRTIEKLDNIDFSWLTGILPIDASRVQ